MARSRKIERYLDRVFGIPVIFLLGLIRRNRSMVASPRRIGIIQPSAIGDMFLISGLLLHLRQSFPNAEIHVFHGPYNGGAVRLLPIHVTAHECIFTQPLAALRELRGSRLDVLINSAPWTRLTAFLTALSGAGTRIGFRSAGQYIHPAFDISVPYLHDRHEVENHRAVAQLFGPLENYLLQVRSIRRQPAIELPYNQLVLMHVSPGGSGAKQKSWPAANWAMLARRLVKKGLVIGFTGALVDREAVNAVMELAALPENNCISLAGRLSLTELCYVLERAKVLVTIDTGVAHLAAALNVFIVGLHGPTRFERWGSKNAHASGLNSPHPAAGYINYGFEEHPLGNEIMASLSVAAVERKVEAILGQKSMRSSELDANSRGSAAIC